MFSTGSGSHDGSNYPTQWALNPSAYQNVANDQVDWAALAQQWIMMKETAPPDQIPQAPPPPNIGNKKDVIDEGGEAPMDVENDKEDSDWNSSVGTSGQDWYWQQNMNWSGSWNGPSGVPPPNSINNSNKPALLPTPFSHYGSQNVEGNSNLDYQNNSSSNEFSSGYWTNNSSNSRSKGPSKRMGRKGPSQSDGRVDGGESVTLDAAKRRQLPAWIREGLEKMEREKQKQLERERERAEREVYLSRKKEETEGAIKLLQQSGLPEKSKFDSDSEESSSEREQRSKKSSSPTRSHSPPPPMTEEERMQHRMLLVRRAMTEVLLQVTSTEIESICQEELNRYRSRHTASAKKMAQYGTPGEGTITASLGLGMYGGETDSSSDESDSDHHQNSINNDSDNQLKETIKRRRAEFAKTERDIENRLSKDEENRTKREMKSNNIDKSDGGGTPEWPESGGERDHSQVDTAQPHGSGSLKSRRYSQKSSSRTPPRKEQKTPPDQRDTQQRKKLKKSKQSTSSSNSETDDSTSESSSSSTSHGTRKASRRGHSRSTETDRSRKKNYRSRSQSTDSEDRSHSRRDRSYSSRRSDRDSLRSERSRRESYRARERSRSRSRRRSRSRSRERRHRRTPTRSRSRDRRRRSRSGDRYRGRSPHGGKRSRR